MLQLFVKLVISSGYIPEWYYSSGGLQGLIPDLVIGHKSFKIQYRGVFYAASEDIHWKTADNPDAGNFSFCWIGPYYQVTKMQFDNPTVCSISKTDVELVSKIPDPITSVDHQLMKVVKVMTSYQPFQQQLTSNINDHLFYSPLSPILSTEKIRGLLCFWWNSGLECTKYFI